MATIEERLTLIENEHARLEYEHTRLKNDNAELKKTIELQTIAIGALVNKAALERLNEKYDKILDVLMSHDRFMDVQLAELRDQHSELDGKVVGLQVEMRQRFDAQDQVLGEMRQHFDAQDQVLGQMRQRFDAQDQVLGQILERLPPK